MCLTFSSVTEIATFLTKYVCLCIYMFKISLEHGNNNKKNANLCTALSDQNQTFLQFIGY